MRLDLTPGQRVDLIRLIQRSERRELGVLLQGEAPVSTKRQTV
jgi:hypothetical protein